MICPWLKGQNIKQCGAVRSTVVLSSFELTALCTSDDHKLCPVFLARKELEEKSLTFNEYLVCYSRCEKRDGANDRTDAIAVNINIRERTKRIGHGLVNSNHGGLAFSFIKKFPPPNSYLLLEQRGEKISIGVPESSGSGGWKGRTILESWDSAPGIDGAF